jgi:hypothetical protein
MQRMLGHQGDKLSKPKLRMEKNHSIAHQNIQEYNLELNIVFHQFLQSK